MLQDDLEELPNRQLYALAHQGNARRVQGDLAAADELLATARYLLRPAGGGGARFTAEIDSLELEGSLRQQITEPGAPQQVVGVQQAQAVKRVPRDLTKSWRRDCDDNSRKRPGEAPSIAKHPGGPQWPSRS